MYLLYLTFMKEDGRHVHGVVYVQAADATVTISCPARWKEPEPLNESLHKTVGIKRSVNTEMHILPHGTGSKRMVPPWPVDGTVCHLPLRR